MRHLRAWAVALGLAALIQFPPPALADDELLVEHIHSALPLYTFDWEQTWPRSFSSDREGTNLWVTLEKAAGRRDARGRIRYGVLPFGVGYHALKG